MIHFLSPCPAWGPRAESISRYRQLTQRDGEEGQLVAAGFGGVPREWRWGEWSGPHKAVCCRAREEIGEIEREDRKQSGSHLPESRSGVATGDLW